MCVWDQCLEGHMILGFFFGISSLIFLILTTFSTPYIHTIYFLSITNPNVKFGALGFCTPSGCSRKIIGYTYGTEVIHWLTRTQVMFGIACLFIFLSLFSLLFGVLKIGQSGWNPVFYRTAAIIGFTLSLLAEIFALTLWIKAHNRFHHEGITAKYGAGLWLGLVGTICAFLRWTCFYWKLHV